jgi:hypothetical protein
MSNKELQEDLNALCEKHGVNKKCELIIRDVEQILNILETPHFHDSGIYDLIYTRITLSLDRNWKESVRSIVQESFVSSLLSLVQDEEPTT